MQEGLEQEAEQLLIRGTGQDAETFLDRKYRAGRSEVLPRGDRECSRVGKSFFLHHSCEYLSVVFGQRE
jgi:hypothetical protein